MIGDPRARPANPDFSSSAPGRIGVGLLGAPASRRHAREARTSEEDAGETPAHPGAVKMRVRAGLPGRVRPCRDRGGARGAGDGG